MTDFYQSMNAMFIGPFIPCWRSTEAYNPAENLRKMVEAEKVSLQVVPQAINLAAHAWENII